MDAIEVKKAKSISKYGNKSKVGLILDMTNNSQMVNNMKIINNDHYLRKLKLKNASDFNRAQIQQKERMMRKSSY